MPGQVTKCVALFLGALLFASCADRPFALALSMVADSLETQEGDVEDGWWCHYTLEVRASGGEEGDRAEFVGGTLAREDFAWMFGAEAVGFEERRQARYVDGWHPTWTPPWSSPTEAITVSLDFRMPDGSLESLTASAACIEGDASGSLDVRRLDVGPGEA